MGAAELSGDVLGEDVAVALGVGRAEEGRHDLERELIEPRELGPERREANVDLELEELDGRHLVCERSSARRLSGRGDGGVPWGSARRSSTVVNSFLFYRQGMKTS